MSAKRFFAIILSLVMIICSISISAYAQEKKLNYVVLGDSIAYGAGVYNSDEACFGRIVANTNGYNYKNYGINGYRTIDLINLLGTEDVSESVSDADIISLSIGGNDYLQQNLPKLFAMVTVGNYEIIDDIEEIFAENFAQIIGTIKELNPDVTILVQTLYNPRWDLLRDFYDIAVVRINRSILGYLEKNPDAFRVIDVNSVFTADHPEYIAIDTVHPSAVGNQVIAKLVLEELYYLGLGATAEPVIEAVGIDQVPFLSFILKFLRTIFLPQYR